MFKEYFTVVCMEDIANDVGYCENHLMTEIETIHFQFVGKKYVPSIIIRFNNSDEVKIYNQFDWIMRFS